ncbi:MAG: hypothetical protein HW374_1326 [Bacteroidetes bacterium]|nr:hypothetical protein [Bacteroidota bacterium]
MTASTRHIHERFLRHLWSRQYLQQSLLRTVDGRTVEVLNVGKMNHESGPDFLEAKVNIGGTVYVGDVEIHRTQQDWLRHHHEHDPRYNKVILHVLLENETGRNATVVESGREIPVLVLGNFLPESIRAVWFKTIVDERERRAERIPCFTKNSGVSAEALRRWFDKLTVQRLEFKLRRFEERLKELARERQLALHEVPRTWGEPPIEGSPEEIPPPHKVLTQRDVARKELWEQVLYEGIMEGLGYVRNMAPFTRLAQIVTLDVVRKLHAEEDERKLQALLFGVAGLLPKISSLKEENSKEEVRRLIRVWENLRCDFRSEILHPADWQFFPTRPMNFPTVRMAAASALIRKIIKDDGFRRIIQTIKFSQGNKLQELQSFFSIKTGDFWRAHYNFDHPSSSPVKSLGVTRIRDMIINTVVPVSLLYARVFHDFAVRHETIELYHAMAPSAENEVTRIIEDQLLKGRMPLDSPGRQQAAIQLYKFYCTEGRCHDCDIGKLVFSAENDDGTRRGSVEKTSNMVHVTARFHQTL